MSNWKNVTEHVLTVYPQGPGRPKTVEPGAILTLSDEQDHIIGTHTGHDQFEKVELEAAKEKPKPATSTAAVTDKPKA